MGDFQGLPAGTPMMTIFLSTLYLGKVLSLRDNLAIINKVNEQNSAY
jgi:hypothetical protein